jgi:glycosyltransferase involved in cell wall biosynthesis
MRVVRNASNLGAGPTRDRLIQEARGRWIAFIDADDQWRPERLETLLASAADDESLVMFDDIEECHDVASSLVPWRRLHGTRGFSADGAPVHVDAESLIDSRSMLVKPMFSNSLRMASGATHGTYRFGEDIFFLLTLLAGGGRLLYVPQAMYRYRITPGSATADADRFSVLRRVLEESLHRFDGDPATRQALERKIARVHRREARLLFTGALRQGRFIEAGRLALRSPSLFRELLRHNLRMLPYHLHRIARGGSPRRGPE